MYSSVRSVSDNTLILLYF